MSELELLRARSGGACELCGAAEAGEVLAVGAGPERAALVCGACAAALADSVVDPNRWFCLREAVWSEVPAVQVAAWRQLHRIDAGWARDLLDQVYLDDETAEWARSGLAGAEAADDVVRVVDSNGAPLADGDSVTLIKDLDVKGAGFTAKRGTLVKGIRLGDDPTHIEGRVNGTAIYLKTEFLKKV
ncbi:MAG: PhnA domain-containing protein [Myxococcota bacterium]